MIEQAMRDSKEKHGSQTAPGTQAKREFTRRSDRIEELVSRMETTGDPAMRAVAQELLQAVIELHGVALERLLDEVAALPQGEEALDRIAQDDLVSNVLSLHGINPVPLKTRVASALEKTRPYLKSHGGNVELTSIDEDGSVHVRLQGAHGGCSSTTATMKSTVEEAIYNLAPEVVTVILEAVPAAPQLVTLRTN